MGIGTAVIRPLKNSLDELPIHVRQLAEMFRKHGQKQNRNTAGVNDLDVTDVPDALRDGWKTDSAWDPAEVAGWGKGDRPDPTEYLDKDYIQQHLDQFADGASRIYTSDSLHGWGPGNRGTTFVFPTAQLQQILDETGGDARELAIRLGLDPTDFLDKNGNPLEVELRHFTPDEFDNLRVPSGNEAGANDQWIPGGHLPTGVPEAVIDIPETATGIGDVENGNGTDYNPGLWPGTAESLTLK